jgi:hypothetical protein
MQQLAEVPLEEQVLMRELSNSRHVCFGVNELLL